ncbi:MAG: valine--tRNA ligase [Candidatus Schekmanbacteria bacterium]|nr:MAG: valine--tRNA ligase [Candidatus Schekmanbacteria bacterium]
MAKRKIIEKGYEPGNIEKKWYDYWLEKKYFHADDSSDKPPYSIVIPPPNVTGSLHMGHALNNTLQDVLIRYKRMDGFNTLWMPGTDHAGIATQHVVEKKLKEEGTDRHELGREKFIERVWKWKEQYGGFIINQLKRLGASCDWDRERFTMDEGLSSAVREVFVRLYNEGLIYRGNYIINWCPVCRTALSDLEVEYSEKKGALYHIRYPFADDPSKGVVVATTRPETMLGDTAVAVNPNDERYEALKGKTVILPLMDREIPVIMDDYVDMEFGTGCLKITPAHDPNDFEIGLRFNLEMINIMNVDGTINENGGKYQGLDRFEARKKVLDDLERQGLLIKVEDYNHSVGHCYRCRSVVEPYLSKQWFVKTKPLAEEAIKAVRDGRIRIIPSMWENSYFSWMENIRDWCISRQIWWGHRIPIWYCKDCGEIIAATKVPQNCAKCSSQNLEQETDVLDTWFSSALWPFSTLGWPEETDALKTFYPTSCLITGFDILFFWVARMIMMGLKFRGDVPFREVYIHALVRDAQGQKMSKSKGNVIDPLLMIDKYGTDAFRFTLVALAAQGRDVKISEERIEGYRHFVNKLWNASRFVLMNIDLDNNDFDFKRAGECLSLETIDKWIYAELKKLIKTVRNALDAYRFNDAASAIYQFLWHQYCDWFIELAKTDLMKSDIDEERKDSIRFVLVDILEKTLRLLHPFMPFVTEEIWHFLPNHGESITIAPFPKEDDVKYAMESVSEIEELKALINGVRNVRGEMNISPASRIDLIINFFDEIHLNRVKSYEGYIEALCRTKSIKFGVGMNKPKQSAVAVSHFFEAYIPLEGLIDIDEEKKRLLKQKAKLEKDRATSSKKLANEKFLANAPSDVIEKEKGKLEKVEKEIKRIENHLNMFEA